MKWMEQQSKYENMIYVALWSMLFAAPILSGYIRTIDNPEMAFNWNEILLPWRSFSIYLLLFLIHNFILAPMVVYRHQRALYIILTGCMLAAFILYECSTRPDYHTGPRHKEHFENRPPLPHDFSEDERPPLPPDWVKGDHEFIDKNPPFIVGEHDIVAVIILVLMIGANLGIKGYFRSREDQKRFSELEKENLAQQLEYLKYQINPHFFMNTLNNIHALIDIDTEKAQATILELSKMMRFILYEGNKHDVPLHMEFDFIRNYITLMRLRYTDKVKIDVDLPTTYPDKTVPPLMLISFIENAFKHGISYQHPSFIQIKVSIEHEKLRFTCHNSKADMPNQEKGGVGLANVKQRLNLLYDDNYTLNIQDEPDTYTVELILPLL